ncbi:MAG TPA: adenylate/guanylate cyclase domain-containing protein [Parafilimonas sp.]|nr:adenylate/guanylate cyclase domain-containing protein [Parafilimonas sp.]
MKTKTGFRKKIRTVLIITLFWTLFACISFISQYFFIYDLVALKRLSGSFPFGDEFIATVIFGIVGGLLAGYVLVFKMSSRYRGKSFVFGVINSGVVFILTYVGLAGIGLFIIDLVYFSITGGISSAPSKSIDNVLFNILSPSFFINVFLFGLLVSCTQFMLQVSDKFGPGILWKFITGKYYHPRQEERIFMFLDLKSSTTIGEKMNSKKFFGLMKEIFSDITEPILDSHGEIYQYVGDEVVVSWPSGKGLADNNCLLCFYGIQEALEERREHYTHEYSLFPSFKAGLHIGEATVGEIGVVKKDIVYSGDVLNTTSRIEGQCNNYDVNILLSSRLLERMQLNGEYEHTALGEIALKGKNEKVVLYTINKGR